MSWDIFVMDIPSDVRRVEEIPEDFKPAPLMSRGALIERIMAIVPTADFSDPTWGNIEGPDYSIEVNIGEDDPVSSFAFHVRGSGDAAAGVVAAILSDLGLRAVDTAADDTTGGFFDAERALESFRRWRDYRDLVIPTDANVSGPATDASPSPSTKDGLLRRLFRRH